ncbi:putative inactive purple acid phosphatase 27 [Triticum urartu]|uniref:Putative inactive purple acid phosphatase 27 n=1 Tax=Triticum urartu TaxID=4572 RepID=M8ABG4_TRIUA|nr:putative inactive purple acid phosphatase 27 [Triticum urartu]
MRLWVVVIWLFVCAAALPGGEQPLSRIAVERTTLAIDDSVHVKASPLVLGLKGESSEWVEVEFFHPNPSDDDWIGVFSPANFSDAICEPENERQQPPVLCTAPIKYQFAKFKNDGYNRSGKGNLKLQLINQREDFSFALFSGALKLAIQDNCLQLSKLLRNGYLKIFRYTYRLGHRLPNGTHIWSKLYSFKASPYPGQDSLQQIVIFGDMGKAEADGSNEFNDFQPGSLNTTNQIIRDLKNIDMVLHIGDICYANGYLSQWDQFTSQIEPIASTVPYMIGSGNHERDWPGTGSFYGNLDSGGECGVPAQTVFYTPAENRAKFWYATDYGMFRFCIANTEEDWRPGTEQYKFIEQCLSSVDRQKQPWLIFLAHRVLGYSSCTYYETEGTFEEPMGREALQELWQKYKVDLAFYGHVHNYERTCPVYQSQCAVDASDHYSGPFKATTHVVVGGAGASISDSAFTTSNIQWSHFRDFDFGFVKLTAFNQSSLLFEYKKSRDGNVYDHFTISRDYRDVLACSIDNCPRTTLAS